MLQGGGAGCDIPEASLVRIFSALVHGIKPSALGGVWASGTAAAAAAAAALPAGKAGKRARGAAEGSAGAGAAEASAAGTSSSSSSSAERHRAATLAFLCFTGLLVGAPRNDVFMEKALRTLQLQEVTLLLGCLVRLLSLHAGSSLGWSPAGSAAGSSSSSSSSSSRALPPPPPLPAVLDWLRLTIDAHYPSLVLEGQLQAARYAQRRVAPPPDSLLGLLRAAGKVLAAQETFAVAAAGLKGQLEHVLNRLPLPKAPAPEYSVELIKC